MNQPVPAETVTVSTVTELPANLPVPLLQHPVWSDRFPWLIQGTTWRGPTGDYDLGLYGDTPVGRALDRWRSLMNALDAGAIIHARQVHGKAIRTWGTGIRGTLVSDGFDGHSTAVPGTVLTVSIADCVPVFIVDTWNRSVMLLHAGWRGLAAGIVERGIESALGRAGDASALHVHFGPAICGQCYEVGPEVHRQLGLAAPAGPTAVDLRVLAADRAVSSGLDAGTITVSTICTRCDPARRLFSHRSGDRGRQMAVLGVRTVA